MTCCRTRRWLRSLALLCAGLFIACCNRSPVTNLFSLAGVYKTHCRNVVEQFVVLRLDGTYSHTASDGTLLSRGAWKAVVEPSASFLILDGFKDPLGRANDEFMGGVEVISGKTRVIVSAESSCYLDKQ